MDSAARRLAKEQSQRVTTWVKFAEEASAHRLAVSAAADESAAHFRERAVEVPSLEGPGWIVLPLGDADRARLGALAHHRELVQPDDRLARWLLSRGRHLVEQTREGLGFRRFIVGRNVRKVAAESAVELGRLHDEVRAGNLIPTLMDVLSDADTGTVPQVELSEALSSRTGLGWRLTPSGTSEELIDVTEFAGLGNAVATMLIALHTELEFRDAAHAAASDIRLAEATEILAGMPLESLREATRGRLPVEQFREAGIHTVLDVFERIDSLEEIPTVGPVTARRLSAAARAIWRTTYESTPVHIDVVERSEAATRLLARLALWGQVRTIADPASELARATAVGDLLSRITRDTTHLGVVSLGKEGADGLRAEIADVLAKAPLARVPAVPEMPDDPWADFLARPAHYYVLLSELGFLEEPGARIHGDVPAEVVDAIRTTELDTQHLRASLRGYQDFAAKFALVQQRVLIGDEMGLGKTVEALAVLAHLYARGGTHFLVVCPAAVMTNWLREVESKTTLTPHLIHGFDHGRAQRRWAEQGGVAVTSYGSLSNLRLDELPEIGCLVADEAHYTKNPETYRTRYVVDLLERVPNAILLTGTPLLNRVDEFSILIGHVRPDLVAGVDDETTPHAFRRLIAPAYLRRNQEDVLTELPEMVEVDEWVPMTKADAAAYASAVEEGNFMAMRRAAAMSGRKSGKLKRLVEIVSEALDNDRRVLVYSHFRDVLDQVAAVLPGRVFGPLHGSVPPRKRQEVVDEFSAGSHGATLVAQIASVGVGLNIQAASVVVICEPQTTPAVEWQAIARAQRMGQVHSVQVHRLLSDEGVDVRVRDVLLAKGRTFDDYARISDLADAAPEAFDITDAELARQVVEAERARLFGAS